MKRSVLAALAFVLIPTASGAHDWYSGLTQPGTSISCCDDRDCEKVSYCTTAEGKEGLSMEGFCRPIDWSRVLPMPSPDGEPHACWSRAGTDRANAFIYCIILGGSA